MIKQAMEHDHTLGKSNSIDALARGVLGALILSSALLNLYVAPKPEPKEKEERTDNSEIAF